MKYIKKYESSEPLDAGEHPENYCNDCGQRNPTWYAPNELWNALCERHEIICPVCFQKRADDAGVNIIFTTEDLKKQPVLDAGEWLDRNLPKNATLRMNGEAICGYLESFSQASITAKQREWEEEKAELVAGLKDSIKTIRAWHRVGHFDSHIPDHSKKIWKNYKTSPEMKMLFELIQKHTNKIKTND